jgi:light-regulated signal transduction histidine kinase (bacteriophytochrome)
MAELKAEVERLRAKASTGEELEQFAYAASHDLQEPLRTISSYLQLVQRRYGPKLDPEARELIEYAVAGARRMHDLINALLDYSRLGAKAEQAVQTDFGGVVKEVLEELQLAIGEAGARITVLPLPRLAAHPLLISEVFQNLVSNALKYRKGPGPSLEIGGRQEKGEWVFWVKDDGIGIDPRYFSRIFRPFQRLHSRDRYPGAGMGLAVCRKAMDRHGGRIWVESQEGQGSTFFFTIPAVLSAG